MLRQPPRSTRTDPLFPYATLFRAMGPMVIRRLGALRGGQPIRSDGPASHLSKAGTPTMGGALILMAVTVEIGRAHVCTPVTNAQLVCRLVLEKKNRRQKSNQTITHRKEYS